MKYLWKNIHAHFWKKIVRNFKIIDKNFIQVISSLNDQWCLKSHSNPDLTWMLWETIVTYKKILHQEWGIRSAAEFDGILPRVNVTCVSPSRLVLTYGTESLWGPLHTSEAQREAAQFSVLFVACRSSPVGKSFKQWSHFDHFPQGFQVLCWVRYSPDSNFSFLWLRKQHGSILHFFFLFHFWTSSLFFICLRS